MFDFAFIFQIHNRQESVAELLRPFVAAQAGGMPWQLIVCDDGSTDDTPAAILSAMPPRSENTVLMLRDAFEIELTWRAMQLVEAEYVAWLQDDDLYETMDFALRAKEIFQQTSDVVALSPKHGYRVDGNFNIVKHWGEYPSTDISFHSPPPFDGKPFVDVDCIDRAPFVFCRWAYDLVGGIDRGMIQDTYSEPDLCLSWRERGYRIGLYHADGYRFRHWDAGSLRPGSKVGRHIQENRQRCIAKHHAYLKTL